MSRVLLNHESVTPEALRCCPCPPPRSRRAPPAGRRPGPCTASQSSTTSPGCAAPTTRTCWPTSRPRTPGATSRQRTSATCSARSSPSSRRRCRTTTSPPRGCAGGWVYRIRRRGRRRSTPCTYAVRPARTVRTTCCWTRTCSPRATTTSSSGSASRARTAPLLAYSVDHEGSEVYLLRVRDLATGDDLPDELAGTYYGARLVGRRTSFLYTTLDETYRPDKVSGTSSAPRRPTTRLVWHEEDRRFELRSSRRAAASWSGSSRAAGTPRRCAWCRPRTCGTRPGARRGAAVPGTRVLRRPPARPGRRPAGGADRPRRPGVPRHDGAGVAARHRALAELLPHDPAVRVERCRRLRRARGGVRALRGVLRLRVLDASGSTLRLVQPDAVGESVRLARNDEQDIAVGPAGARGLGAPARHRRPRPGDRGGDARSTCRRVTRSLDGYRCEVVHAVADDGVAVPVTLIRRGGDADDAGTFQGRACSTATAPTSRAWTRSSGPTCCRCPTAA